MIYSRTNIFHNTNNFSNLISKLEIGLNPKGAIQLKNIDYLRNCKFENDDIFYHHSFYGIKLVDFLENRHWEHMRRNKNVKLLHINANETFGNELVMSLHNVINTHQVNPKQIYIILYDTLHKTFLENELSKLNISGINIGIFNSIFARTIIPTTLLTSVKKFSILSRNFKVWRLKLFLNLIENDLLDEFIYSFHSMNPYEKTTIDIVSILNNEHLVISDKAKNWVSKIPYKLKGEEEKTYDTLSDRTFPVWTNLSYNAILSSDFNLIIETDFENNTVVSLISEKTYKALACSKPFLIFSTMGFLSDLRKIGYKTFSPYIDETYDTIDDNEQRLLALVNEVKRIHNLPDNEYKILLDNCNTIASENLKIFKEKKAASVNENNFNPTFDFLKSHLKKYEGWDFPVVIL